MLSIDEIIARADMEACEDCSYYGEPNGCNRTEGTCKGYEILQDAIYYLERYRSYNIE